MHAPRMITTVAVAIAAAGALLLAGCGSSSTASAPSVAASAPNVSSEALASADPLSSAPAEVATEQVVAKWTCVNEGGEVTCTCEGSEADCKSTVAKPSTTKGATGIVKWFNNSKGFGFIAPDDGGNDIFVHISELERIGLSTLAQNQKVEFEVQGGPGRYTAGQIQIK